MGFRNHLTRKSVVDINGRQTTVFVKPESVKQFDRIKVLSIVPQSSNTYMSTMAPTPLHRAQLAIIAEADYDLRERMAADPDRVPAGLEILGSDLDPVVRNIVSNNPSANAKALANIVTQESNPFGSDENYDDFYQSETLLNVALHPNADWDTLDAVARFAENNEAGSKIATARMNGEYVYDPRMSYAS